MIPLPHALDQDQKANARVLAGAGGGWMILQTDVSPQRLGGEIGRLMDAPAELEQAAAAGRSVGLPDAVDRLADLVEKVAA
jgi:UDP-N-acetylglucosamine--N-acetylmuramyl-(pentapeptide) pyrophosphoryl-undecaprenol N-acetylglucosamine transferase